MPSAPSPNPTVTIVRESPSPLSKPNAAAETDGDRAGADREEDAHGTADMEDPQRDEEDEEGDDHAAQATMTRGAQRLAAAAINAANPDASSAHGAIDLSVDD